MTPRPGSKVEKAIQFIRQHQVARSKAIADHIDSSSTSIAGLLGPYVDAGVLLCCKVEVPGERTQNEYRIGSGIPSRASGPELKPKAREPLFAQRKGMPWLPPTLNIPVLTDATTQPEPQEATAAAECQASDISINEHGELRFMLDDKQHHLTPAQTASLGSFLLKTEALWRPT